MRKIEEGRETRRRNGTSSRNLRRTLQRIRVSRANCNSWASSFLAAAIMGFEDSRMPCGDATASSTGWRKILCGRRYMFDHNR
jgi:hypothetical protein